MMHHILVRSLLNLHFHLQSSHHLFEMWTTLCSKPKPQKHDGWSEEAHLNLLIP
jgi:hypothetical protein